MTKLHHPIGSDAIDLIEEDFGNQDASRLRS